MRRTFAPDWFGMLKDLLGGAFLWYFCRKTGIDGGLVVALVFFVCYQLVYWRLRAVLEGDYHG